MEAFTGPCEGGPFNGTSGIRTTPKWPVWTYRMGNIEDAVSVEPKILGEYRWSAGVWKWHPERHLKLVSA